MEHDEQELRKMWVARARDRSMTMETLPAFLKELADFEHDYGSICVAIGAAALAAAHVIDRSPRGGITGFQAGAVGWEFLRGWHQWPEDGVGHQLIDFDHLLYPQYEATFTTMSRDVFGRLQEAARKHLAEADAHMHPNVRSHLQKIVKGRVPFGLGLRER